MRRVTHRHFYKESGDFLLHIETPLLHATVKSLRYGDEITLTGIIYTARDAAHKKMIELIKRNEPLPFNPENQIIYYMGPCPNKPGEIIGSAGPTTSTRMDAYAPDLIKLGLTGMIGKGNRSAEVVNAMIQYGAVYLGAVGGTGALTAQCIRSQEIIAFPELGAEAIRKLYVENFPLTVIIDCMGGNLYESGRANFARHTSCTVS